MFCVAILQGTHGQQEVVPGGGTVVEKGPTASDVLAATDEEGGDWEVLGGDVFDGNRDGEIDIVSLGRDL